MDRLGPPPATIPSTQATDAEVAAAIAAAKPLCVLSNAAMAIPDATLTAVTFSTEVADTDTMHTTGGSNSRITIVTAGIYLFTVNVLWADAMAGNQLSGLYKSGTLNTKFIAETSLSTIDEGCSVILSCAAADYFEAKLKQSSGNPVNADVKFSAVRLSADA